MENIRSFLNPESKPFRFWKRGKPKTYTMGKYNEIWDLVDRNNGVYLYYIMKWLMHLEKERKVSSKQISLELALSTLNMVAFMGDNETGHESSKYSAALKKWNKLRRNLSNSNSQSLKSVEQILHCVFEGEPEEMLGTLVLHATTFHGPVREFCDLTYSNIAGEEKKVNLPSDITTAQGVGGISLSENPRFSIFECGEFSFSYQKMKKILTESQQMSGDVINLFKKR